MDFADEFCTLLTELDALDEVVDVDVELSCVVVVIVVDGVVEVAVEVEVSSLALKVVWNAMTAGAL